MNSTSTVDRIVEAAAALFAERGFAETSLRTITSTAGVNLAAVNYHFGSKKELIQAVFAQVLTPFCEALDKELTARQAAVPDGRLSVEQLLDCLFGTLVTVMEKGNQQPQRFMRLLGMAYIQSQGHLRHFIVARYGNYYSKFISALKQAAPESDPVTFIWRLYFMLGASVFTLSSFDAIASILKEDFNKETSIDDLMTVFVPAAAALIRAEDASEVTSA